MKKIQKKSIENILCLLIIICPIFDMVSFGFRNMFHTNFSPSTFLRPMIPTVMMIYLFLTRDKKTKGKILAVAFIYLLYAILHLVVFQSALTGSSYSGVKHEAQYLMNYTYMIVNLFIYLCVFYKSDNIEKLSKSVLISSSIYMVSIIIAIGTKTSSSTYIEGMGYKGWFESGNSLGSILILSLFIIIRYAKDKKYRKIAIPLILLEGIFLTLLLGTRVGLLGFILVIVVYLFLEVIMTFVKKGKMNKKMLAGGIAVIASIVLVVITIGSTTMQRRKHLQEIEKNIVDSSREQESHVTGSILEIKEKIDQDLLEKGYMNEPQKQSIKELYQIANQWNIKNNDLRMQQLIYNVLLVKNQHNPIYILLGNGYMANFRELVLEMEIPAFLFNFGWIGLILYFAPFAIIFMIGIHFMFQNRKKITIEFLMYLIGSGFTFALSFFAGYTFFHSSNMMIIIVLNTLLMREMNTIKEKEDIK